MVKMLNTRRASYIVFGLIVLASLYGCPEFHPQPDLMIPMEVSTERRVGDSVCIYVTGGLDETVRNPLGLPYLPKESFAKAVDMALVKAGLFSGVVECNEDPQYQLDLFLAHAEGKPGASIFNSSPAVVVAHWKLIDRKNGQILVDEQITGSFVLPPCADVTRSRQALEGAARDNIKQGLAQIAQSLE